MLLSSAAALAALAVYVLVVRTYWGQRLDEYAFTGRDVISDQRAGQASEFLGVVSIGSLVLVTILVAAIAYARRRPRLALLAAASVAAAVIATEVLKLVVLQRPILVETALSDDGNTYPSGHVTVGMAVALAVVLVVPARLRMASALGAGAVGAGFAVAVVAGGWHRPSDAVGAFLVCLATAALAAAVARAWPDRSRAEHGDGDSRPTGVGAGRVELALGALGLAILVLFVVAAISVRDIPWTSPGAGFLLSSAALVVLGFTTAWTLAVVMRADNPSATRLDHR